MATIYISVGSNEQRDEKIRAAYAAIQLAYGNIVVSSVYESESVGFSGPAFYNLVIAAETEESPQDVAARLKRIEDDNGRVRSGPKFSNRALDLDLLLYDDVITDEGVQIPRHEITENAFVLWPMAELAPTLVHPITQNTYEDMWKNYRKNQSLKPVTFDW
ncbi:2-amino-4-hydroxy-6-hydroxymethyldihydropteridine diphosphokinase [Echinimonas agarilytica]|uniref:2-amino-4-hydroxy-6-hydroxymethyldihydropteridine diphosphokinase n=1 Tax=Echinimonas agarilytica TaxID=1215918 RepID=A0AA41W7U2_9GAMM|nr:2-amino-4-hydroxy-6-hydroxymethyldihydropteridine diphosphokinase [Echinimonas agarilytica]MCM2680371.1 2-amino-4-hydroxy-6-hydroxymethyldihydropteridine diphosphokinase [Echinimonas agarilytica]